MAKNIFFIISALPILISQFLFFPATWGKASIFRILMILLIYILIYCLIFKKVKINFSQIKKAKVLWLFLLLIVLAIASTIFSQNPYFSFWGNPQRAGGSFNLILFFIFTILAFLIIKKEQWQKIWDFNFIVASIIATLAIVSPYNDRPVSTMGGPAILALYLALLTPLAISFAIKEKTRKKWFYYISSGLFSLVIFLTMSRGVILGLFIAFLFLIIFYKEKKLLWLKLTAVFLIAVSLAGILVLRPINIEDRISVWTISLNALKEKPLLGQGPENFSIAFDKYYDSSLPELNGQWFDRAHNIIFDISTTYGIPFLIIYFLLFIIVFLKIPSPWLKSCFIIYFISNLFNFDVFSTYLIIFLLLAYSMSKIYENPLIYFEAKEKTANPFKQVAMIIVFLLFFSFTWIISFKPLYINKEINEAKYLTENQKPKEAIEKLDSLLSKHSVIDHYVRINYATTASRIISSKNSKLSLKTSLLLMEKSINALEESTKLRPKYTRAWYLLNVYANMLFRYEPSEELKEKAQSFCQKAKELSHSHPLVIEECLKTESL